MPRLFFGGLPIFFAFVVLPLSGAARSTGHELAGRLSTINSDTLPYALTGKVINGEGEPLIGASIVLPGRSTGTVTDFSGVFSIVIQPYDRYFEVSYTGYLYQKILLPAPAPDTLTIMLRPDPNIWLGGIPGTQPLRPTGLNAERMEWRYLPALHFTHPYQLLRGRFAGLIVSQAGNDPWDVPILRHRGVSSLSQAANPLWVVDGLPGVAPTLLDRQSIDDVKLLRRPVDLARYGLQAGAGVLEVNTTHRVTAPFAVRYQGQLTFERATRLPRVANAAEYVERFGAGADFGYATDWMEEVTRRAISQGHQLSLGGRRQATQWRTEGSWRDVRGVGRESAWQQAAGRVMLQQNIGGERLVLKAQAAGQLRRGTRDYAETFFYATKMNPTAPVRFDEPPNGGPLLNALYDFSVANLRSYFELVNSTDHFNPAAIQAASMLYERQAANLLSAQADWQLADPLRLTVVLGRQLSDDLNGEENRTYGYYRSVRELNVPGRANRERQQVRRRWLKTTLRWEHELRDGLLELSGNYTYQSRDLERAAASGFGFATDDFRYDDFEFFLVDDNSLQQTNYDENTRLFGFGIDGKLRWRWLRWESVLRYEGARALGTDNRQHPTGGTELQLDLNQLLNLNGGNRYDLHAGYARIGRLPRDLTYARGPYSPATNDYPYANPTLGPERQDLLNLGFGWHRRPLYGSLDYYVARTRDPIVKIFRQDLPAGGDEVGVNLAQTALRNRTWEFRLGWQTTASNRWRTELRWARPRTYVEATGQAGPGGFFNDDGNYVTQASGPGGFIWTQGTGLIALDAPFGQLLGRQFNEAATRATGTYTTAETFSGTTLPAPNEAYGVIGNALPKQTLSWLNTLRLGNWELELMLRGDFGHELAHLRRGELESYVNQVEQFPQSRNFLLTDDDLPNNTAGGPRFTDRYIERADYLSLDYLSLQHTSKLRGRQRLILSLAAQNILLWTAYSGTDPAPRYVDPGGEINGNRADLPEHLGQLAPGLDRRAFYPRTRALTISIAWHL